MEDSTEAIVQEHLCYCYQSAGNSHIQHLKIRATEVAMIELVVSPCILLQSKNPRFLHVSRLLHMPSKESGFCDISPFQGDRLQ